MRKKLNFIFTLTAIICLSVSGINTANAGCNFAGSQGYCNLVPSPVGEGEEEWDLECQDENAENTNMRCKLIITQQ